MRARRRVAVACGAAAVLLLVSGCSGEASLLTDAQATAGAVTAAQQANLGAEPSTTGFPGPFTAADLVAVAGTPEVVDPESCRSYVASINVPGQVILPDEDAESTDTVVIAPHLGLDPGFVEQAIRVLPDTDAATQLVTDLRTLAEQCTEFDYGAATNVNRFVTVETGDLPFGAEGYRSVLTVRGTEEVVATDEIYVLRVENVVATIRGTAERTQPFAQTVLDNLNAER